MKNQTVYRVSSTPFLKRNMAAIGNSQKELDLDAKKD
jgi:hypothetical protein